MSNLISNASLILQFLVLGAIGVLAQCGILHIRRKLGSCTMRQSLYHPFITGRSVVSVLLEQIDLNADESLAFEA